MGERGIAALRNLLPRYREDVDAYGQTFKGDMVSAEGLGLYPEDQGGDSSAAGRYADLDQAVTDQIVQDALDIDADELLKSIDAIDTDVVPKRIRDAQAAEKADRVQQTIDALDARAKGGGLGIGGYRYGAMDAPDSAWKVSTPHLDRKFGGASAAEWGRRGTGGIRGRMLPRAGKGFGGRNPFAGEAPLPGSPDYAEYLIDSMGFDPKKFQREIEEAVARDVPFVQMDDGQGNSYLIDKKTQAVILGPFPTGDNSVSSIPGIGSMAEGGLAAFAKGDLVEKFPRKNGQISGPGTEKSDDIPAMLSDGEFVTNAAALRGIGRMAGASANDRAEQRRLGAREMYKLQRKGMKAAGVG